MKVVLFCGGMHEMRRIADYADLHRLPLAMHGNGGSLATIAAAHVAAAPADGSGALDGVVHSPGNGRIIGAQNSIAAAAAQARATDSGPLRPPRPERLLPQPPARLGEAQRRPRPQHRGDERQEDALERLAPGRARVGVLVGRLWRLHDERDDAAYARQGADDAVRAERLAAPPGARRAGRAARTPGTSARRASCGVRRG